MNNYHQNEDAGKFSWEEKEIDSIRLTMDDRSEILRYVGYSGQPLTDEFESQLQICMEKVNAVAQPRLIATLFQCEPVVVGDVIVEYKWPESLNFLTGEDIHTHLKECREVLLFGATIGASIDRAIRVEEMREPVHALLMDACGSTLIESVCDHFEAILRRRYRDGEEHWHLTTRFSPGYGDLPLEIQNHYADVIEARRIGLTVTPEHIMIPRKSVTAIIGIADHEIGEKHRSCDCCNMNAHCRFRKHGVLCGE